MDTNFFKSKIMNFNLAIVFIVIQSITSNNTITKGGATNTITPTSSTAVIGGESMELVSLNMLWFYQLLSVINFLLNKLILYKILLFSIIIQFLFTFVDA